MIFRTASHGLMCSTVVLGGLNSYPAAFMQPSPEKWVEHFAYIFLTRSTEDLDVSYQTKLTRMSFVVASAFQSQTIARKGMEHVGMVRAGKAKNLKNGTTPQLYYGLVPEIKQRLIELGFDAATGKRKTETG